MNSRLILERLYNVRPRQRRRPPGLVRRVVRLLRSGDGSLAEWSERYNWYLVAAALIFAFWIGSHAYYYNRLIDLEFNVRAAWAQVEVGQQKRNHIQRTLAALSRYYASYEIGTLSSITGLRTEEGTKSPPAQPDISDASPLELLGQLKAVAEQYPSLQLGATVQHFAQTVVASETDIAEKIMFYNNAVNIYTTMISSFPGMIFAPVLGFESYEFYTPEDPSVLLYREVDL